MIIFNIVDLFHKYMIAIEVTKIILINSMRSKKREWKR